MLFTSGRRRLQPVKSSLLVSLPLLFVLFLATPSECAQNLFNGPRDYVVGPDPESVAVGDFNGDGRPDIATANRSSNEVSVLLQSSDGDFTPAVNYPVGDLPTSLRVGDANGDGKLDLLLIHQSENTIGVLLGNGDGTFQSERLTSISSPWVATYAVGDFNADGKVDIAIPVALPQIGTYATAVMLGNGDGTFQAAVNYPLGGPPMALVVADMNNNGKLDLVSGGDGVSVLFGNGDGTFQSAINTAVSTGEGFVVSDFNQDGNLDIATETNSLLTLLTGDGNGNFQPHVLGVDARPIAAGDLNGDGHPDLIAHTQTGLNVLLNNGSESFTVGQSLHGLLSAAIALADLDGDQQLDLIAAQNDTHSGATNLPDIVSTVHGTGDGTFATFPAYSITAGTALPFTASVLGSLTAADLNGDNKVDLAVGVALFSHGVPSATDFGILVNNGSDFSSATVNPLQTGFGSPIYVTAGDFNGDARTDLAIASNDIAFVLGNGNGTFQSDVHYGGGMSGPMATGDFNKDGKLDVIGASLTAAELSVLLGNGDGSFGFPVNSSTGNYPAGDVVRALAVADFDGNGKLDAAALVGGAGFSAQLAVLLGNGDGTFSLGPTYSVGFHPTSVASGDLNGDGIPDIVVGNADGFDAATGTNIPSAVVVLLGVGNGSFSTPVSTIAGNGIASVAIADFNLDGKADVAISNLGWNDVSLLQGNGDGSLRTPIQFFLNNILPISGALAAADFDGNGRPDLAVAGVTSVSVLGAASIGLVAGPGGSSATVNAGETANYTLSIGGAGVTGTATLTCSGAPQGATCMLPSTIPVNGSTSSSFTVSVSTTSRTAATSYLYRRTPIHWEWATGLLALIALATMPRVGDKRKARLTATLCLLLVICSCGGTSPQMTSPGDNPSGTPAGTYTLTVTTSIGSNTQNLNLRLTVQ